MRNSASLVNLAKAQELRLCGSYKEGRISSHPYITVNMRGCTGSDSVKLG